MPFRSSTLVAVVIATALSGNRIVISFDAGTSRSFIHFYTGLPGETPGAITSDLNLSGNPELILESGTLGPRVARLGLSGTDAGGTDPTVLSVNADNVVTQVGRSAPYRLPSGTDASAVAQWPDVAIPPLANVVAGAVRGTEPWLLEAGEVNTSTDGAGDFIIDIGGHFTGVGSVLVQVQGPVPCVVVRQAVGIGAGARYRAFDLAGVPLASTAIVADYQISGW